MQQRVSTALLGLSSRPQALYRFFDRTDVLLYVGITADLGARLITHRRDKPWWAQVHNITVEHYDNRTDALKAEREAIEREKPLYNVVGNELVATRQPELDARQLAERVVRWATDDPEAVLAEARRGVAEAEEDDELAGSDPVVWAAELAVTRVAIWEARLWRAINDFVDTMPREQLARAEARAARETPAWVDEDRDEELSLLTLRFLGVEVARSYLDTLAPAEREGWTLCAKQAVRRHASEDDIVLQAAQMADRYRTRGLYYSGMCRGAGQGGATCAQRADTAVWLGNCSKCPDSACSGHLVWCTLHLESVASGEICSAAGERFQIIGFETVAPYQGVGSSHDGRLAMERTLRRSANEVPV